MKDNGIEVREELILPMRSDLEDYSLENGYMVTKEFLEKQIPCTAIFAISDMLAIGAGKALSDAGYKVPEDISLAGFDGVEIGKYVIPSLTTLKQPVDSMARETARILFDIIGKRRSTSTACSTENWWCGILRCRGLKLCRYMVLTRQLY